jgi:aerobic-type carbon monoxide dehydrogenase small subunit (CoxS/CutS family)
MKIDLQFTLNGKPQHASTESERSLLDVLREDLGLTGTKYGCGEGQCRACTVLLDGRPVQSCLTPASSVASRKVETIEGLANGARLHPVQKAFVEAGAMQCGYCVPGMVMSAVALLRRNPGANRSEIVDGMNGNICRCCGYLNIVAAVERARELNRQEGGR